jgi:hypothetical protein
LRVRAEVDLLDMCVVLIGEVKVAEEYAGDETVDAVDPR